MPEKLDFPWKSLENSVEAALQSANIYEMGSYGWLNENDVDPNYVGHAMWQTDQPHVELDVHLGDQPVRRRPKAIDENILTLGEDFNGLMLASRLSIGLVLLWKTRETSNLLNESAFFWLHHIDAYLKLDIASDRLRSLLVMACTGLNAEEYKLRDKKNGWYITPFQSIAPLLFENSIPTDHLESAINDLPEFSSRIYRYRIQRNAIVHEVATRNGLMTRDSIRKVQQRYDREQIHGFSPSRFDYSDIKEVVANHNRNRRRKIDEAVATLTDWYKLLINTSNEVFQVEHAVRRARSIGA